MLHKLIRRYEPLEDEFYVVNDVDDDVNNALENDAAMSTFRDAQVASMWADYQAYVANHMGINMDTSVISHDRKSSAAEASARMPFR